MWLPSVDKCHEHLIGQAVPGGFYRDVFPVEPFSQSKFFFVQSDGFVIAIRVTVHHSFFFMVAQGKTASATELSNIIPLIKLVCGDACEGQMLWLTYSKQLGWLHGKDRWLPHRYPAERIPVPGTWENRVGHFLYALVRFWFQNTGKEKNHN